MNTLKAEKSSMDVKAKRLRREGFVTGNVFGREIKGSIPVKISKNEAERLLKTNGKGSQVLLNVDGTEMDVLIKEIDYNSLKGQVDEIDFQALVSGEKVHSVAEIHLLNHEKVTTGVLQQMLKEVSYRALPSALVEKIELDVGGMRVGDTIRVRDLAIASDKDVQLQTDLDTVVVEVYASKNTAADEDAEDGGSEAEGK